MANIPTKNNRPINITGTISERMMKVIDTVGQIWERLNDFVKEVVMIKKRLGDIDLKYVETTTKELDLYALRNVVEDTTPQLGGDLDALDNNIQNVGCILFDTDYSGMHQEGCMHWNTDEGAVEIGMPGGKVNLQMGLEQLHSKRLQNDSGVDIKNGDLVYISSSTGKIALAKADAFLTSRVAGMATEDIDNGSSGWVCISGIVRGDDTEPLDTSSYSVGTSLFLSASTAGAFTNSLPSAPNYKIFIGRVVRSHAVQGEINIRTVSTPNLSGLSDVNETAPDDGAVVKWNDSSGYFEYSSTEPAWDDLNFDVVRSGGPVANRPDDVTINNVYYKEFTSANNQTCGAEEEIPHNALLGGNFYPHAHGFLKSGESSGTTGITIRIYWELRQSTGTTNGYVDISKTSAELAANGNKIDFYNSSFTGSTELGAQLALRLDRTAGDAGDVIITTYGIHYQIDDLGSRTATTK